MTAVPVVTWEKWIPDISDEELAKLYRRIKPVIRFWKLGLWYLWRQDLRTVAYTWSPKIKFPAFFMKPLKDITTFHGFGYHGFFKPSIAEVLAQIPADLVDKVVAFEIIESPETVDDLNRESEALNAGYHVAVTRLYTRPWTKT
jgi:hypothetical protein